MHSLLQLMLILLLGLSSWRAAAYAVAWRRTREELFAVTAGIEGLCALLCLASLLHAGVGSFVEVILIAVLLTQAGVTAALRRTYRDEGAVLLFRQPRHR